MQSGEARVAGYPAAWPKPWWATGASGAAGDGDEAAGESVAGAERPAPAGGVPEILAIDGRRFPYATASDGEHVYWTTVHAGAVQRVRVSGDTPEVLARGLVEPRSLLVDDHHVYVGTGAGLVRIPRAGGAARMWLRRVQPGGLAADRTHVFVADQRGRRILRVDKRTRERLTLARTGSAPEALTLAGDQVVWAEERGKRLLRAPRAGGPASALARLPAMPFAIAADRQHVYAAPFGRGTLIRIALADGAIETVAAGLGDVHSIAVDRTLVYWADLDGNSVWCANKRAPVPALLAARQTRADGLSLGGGSIFWITSQRAVGGRGGVIMRLALPTERTGDARTAVSINR
jgi:hypothetical protein